MRHTNTTHHNLDTRSATVVVRALYHRRIIQPQAWRVASYMVANDPTILDRLGDESDIIRHWLGIERKAT